MGLSFVYLPVPLWSSIAYSLDHLRQQQLLLTLQDRARVEEQGASLHARDDGGVSLAEQAGQMSGVGFWILDFGFWIRGWGQIRNPKSKIQNKEPRRQGLAGKGAAADGRFAALHPAGHARQREPGRPGLGPPPKLFLPR